MTIFNGEIKRRDQYLARAQQIGNRLARGEKREKLFFSNKCWCEAMYVCQKGQCDHRFYADEVGVPVSLAYAERAIFQNLQDVEVGKWPVRFVQALPVGMDGKTLEAASKKLALFILADSKHGLYNHAVTPAHYSALGTLIELFENDSQDADAWEAAAKAARQASHTVDTNYRLESDKAFIAAGDKACYAASYLGSMFRDPRYIAEGISWAAWAIRYKTYAELMAGVAKAGSDVPVDRNGNVNVGLALFSYGEWARRADRCEHVGEEKRQALYGIYGNELLRLIRQNASQNGFGALGWLTRLLPSRRPAMELAA